MRMVFIPEPVTFEWDSGNLDKNLIKHGVTNKEIEEAFDLEKKIILKDDKHSKTERRYMLWSKTSHGEEVTIIFTIRSSRVRVISARAMNKKERRAYEEKA